MDGRRQRPSIYWGARAAARLWRTVAAVWLVGMAAFVPVSVVLHGAAIDGLANIPAEIELPVGERAILVSGVIGEVADTLGICLVFAVVFSWAWTVLWHAGVAQVTIWDPDGPAGVARVLGLGFGAWWRYCRLSLCALTGMLVFLSLVWFPLWLGIEAAHEAMAEDRMVLLISVGIAFSPMVKFLVWGATLRGAWHLARPDARSALMAWFRGLVGVFRQPVTTIGTIVVLGLAQAAFTFVPLVAPVFIPSLRGTLIGTVVAAAATLSASFFAVALFVAFAPVSGIVGQSEGDEA